MIWSVFNHYRGILLTYYNHLRNCSIKYGCKKVFISFFLLHAINGQEALVAFV